MGPGCPGRSVMIPGLSTKWGGDGGSEVSARETPTGHVLQGPTFFYFPVFSSCVCVYTHMCKHFKSSEGREVGFLVQCELSSFPYSVKCGEILDF